jgi:hypothetical protein
MEDVRADLVEIMSLVKGNVERELLLTIGRSTIR